MNKGLPIVISAPSGCGKDTILEQLYKKNANLTQSVSATTRAMREGEIDGVSYHFTTVEAFEKMIANGEVLEYTQYCGNYYGTLKSEVERAKSLGKHLILEIEVDGATQIKRQYPEAVLVMVTPPNAAEQSRRLHSRGRDTEESIARRLKRAEAELEYLPKYDYLIVNESDKLDRATEDFLTIAHAEALRTAHRADFGEKYFAK